MHAPNTRCVPCARMDLRPRSRMFFWPRGGHFVTDTLLKPFLFFSLRVRIALSGSLSPHLFSIVYLESFRRFVLRIRNSCSPICFALYIWIRFDFLCFVFVIVFPHLFCDVYLESFRFVVLRARSSLSFASCIFVLLFGAVSKHGQPLLGFSPGRGKPRPGESQRG